MVLSAVIGGPVFAGDFRFESVLPAEKYDLRTMKTKGYTHSRMDWLPDLFTIQ
jgi:hypothetical protein